jgi:hypothetical protein
VARSAQQRANALRWLSELAQQPGDVSHRAVSPLLEGKALVDSWIEGEVWLHVNVRFGAGLPDVEPYEFCAWLKRRPPSAWLQAGDNAICHFDDLEACAVQGQPGLAGSPCACQR